MFKFIHHLLIPHKGNNHRSKIIHNSSLFLLIILILFTSWTSILTNRIYPEVLGISYSISDNELLNLVNRERLKNNAKPLRIDERLKDAAWEKANHMFNNDYWAHYSPENTSPWKFIIDSGYDYSFAGENLAKGFSNANDAVEAWMNSKAHRENILSTQYDDIGFAVIEGRLQGENTVLIVEMFGKEKKKFLSAADSGTEALVLSSSDRIGELEGAEVEVNGEAQVPLLGVEKAVSANLTDGSDEFYKSSPVLDIFFSTKTFSFAILSVLLMAFILDFMIVTRRRVSRIVGDNMDHIILLTIFIVFIFVHNIGVII